MTAPDIAFGLAIVACPAALFITFLLIIDFLADRGEED